MHLAMVEPGESWQVLSDTWDHAVHAPLRWSSDAEAVFFTAEDHGRHHVYRYAIDSRSAEIAVRGGWVQSFDVAAGVIVSVADAMSHPARASAQRGAEAPRRIERFNDELLAKFRFGEHEEVTLQGAQGEPVQMWVITPPGFDRKKKYPLLHAIHGGPHAASGD